MSEQLNFFTALLGLLSAILVFRGNKSQNIYTNSKDDPYKGLKKTFSIVGSISLVLILYFGYMILMIGLPGLMDLAMNIGKRKEAKNTSEIVAEYDYSKLQTKNQIAFRAAQLITSYKDKEKQYGIIILETLKDGEFDLTISILASMPAGKKKDYFLEESFNYFIDNKKYIYALKVADEYSGSKKNEVLQNLIEKMYNNELVTEQDDKENNETIKMIEGTD